MKNLSFIGKLLFALPMAMFGFGHFMSANDMKGMVPIPGGVFWVYVTGAGLLLAAIAIIINKKARLATLLLAIELFLFAVLIWFPGFLDQDQAATSNFLKDLALSGAALFISSQSEN